ncbi:hypothetical protein ACKWTF_006611 [Chironomus riparius]
MKNFNAKVLSQNFQYYFPTNIKNTFRAFETSWETDNLESEDNRNIYCELIDWRKDFNWNANKNIILSNKIATDNAKLDDYDEDDDDNKHKSVVNDNQVKWWTEIELKGLNYIEPLSMMAIKTLAQDYKSGKIDERIFCHDYNLFGRLMELNIPLSNLLELDNEVYWTRVVESKIKDQVRWIKCMKDSETNWKKIGIELCYTEFVENLTFYESDLPAILEFTDNITKRCSKFIENLTIRKVNMNEKKLANEFNPKTFSRIYRNDEVSHISLEFLKNLKNLKNISITFNPQISFELYEPRFFQVSVHDIENFSKSLECFCHLESLEITKTDLEEHAKLFHLLSSIEKLRGLKALTLTHCNISSKESGAIFASFLSKSMSLTEINLKDNALRSDFCHQFSLGMQKFNGILQKLNLSMNPILHDGLEFIMSSIVQNDNVVDLDISTCDGFSCTSYGTAFQELINLISTSRNLQHLDISNNIIASGTTRKEFIRALGGNYHISTISCLNCDFSTKEDVDIHILCLRNEYYRQNDILRKDSFTRKDEIEIEKWLRRTKHPLSMRAQMYMPTENLIKWKRRKNKKVCKQSVKD